MPYILNFEYNNEIFSLINMHLKCCGGTNSQEESRRYEAVKHLHNYLNNHLLDRNIIIVGDLIFKPLILQFNAGLSFLIVKELVIIESCCERIKCTLPLEYSFVIHLFILFIVNKSFDAANLHVTKGSFLL